MTKKLLCSVCAAVASLLVTASAQASVVYSFGATDVAAFGSGPFGTVTLTADGSDMDVRVDLRSDLDFVLTGGPHSIFTFNASGVALGDISDILFNGVPRTGITTVANAPATPYGTFTLGIDCGGNNQSCGGQGGSNPFIDPLTFTIANATYTDFGMFNTAGASFGADVLCRTGSCQGSTGSIAVTGPGVEDGGGSGPQEIPEPGALALVGLALTGLALSRRR